MSENTPKTIPGSLPSWATSSNRRPEKDEDAKFLEVGTRKRMKGTVTLLRKTDRSGGSSKVRITTEDGYILQFHIKELPSHREGSEVELTATVFANDYDFNRIRNIEWHTPPNLTAEEYWG